MTNDIPPRVKQVPVCMIRELVQAIAGNYDEGTYCLQESCAWYLSEHGRCGMAK